MTDIPKPEVVADQSKDAAARAMLASALGRVYDHDDECAEPANYAITWLGDNEAKFTWLDDAPGYGDLVVDHWIADFSNLTVAMISNDGDWDDIYSVPNPMSQNGTK